MNSHFEKMIEESLRKKRVGGAIRKTERQFIVESFTQDTVFTIISALEGKIFQLVFHPQP